MLLDSTQQSYYTRGRQQEQVLSEGHALSQQGWVRVDGCGEGRGAGSGAGAVTTAPRAGEGQGVGGEGGGAGAEEDTRPPSNRVGPLYPAELQMERAHRDRTERWGGENDSGRWGGREQEVMRRKCLLLQKLNSVIKLSWLTCYVCSVLLSWQFTYLVYMSHLTFDKIFC